ncbi:winged helix-turn-helix domain-containing protein [Botrimarina hoheduenensis]|nr:winged helix-turn-helix domain-containing protein [Botrimarina hoheduenensis]
MAKKTAKKPLGNKPVQKAAKKPVKKSAPVAKSADKPSANKAATPAAVGAAAPTEQAIGHAAGVVWKALHTGGPQTLATLKKLPGASGETALMALGWLAREGKLHFETHGRSIKVSLR